MNNKPTSNKPRASRILVYILITTGVLVLAFVAYERYYWMSNPPDYTSEPISDSLSANPINQQTTSVDSTEIIKADRSMVDSLELSWGADRVNIKQALDNIAGVEGNAEWSIDYTVAEQKANPDLFTALGHAENKDGKKPKTFDITLLVNRKNKQFKVVKAVDNGEVLKGAMIVMSLALEGGYSEGTSL